jgi:hypothetical protein
MPQMLLSGEALDAIALTAGALQKRLYNRCRTDTSDRIVTAVMPVIIAARMKDLLEIGQDNTTSNPVARLAESMPEVFGPSDQS